mmetsp:Transcript_15821/g.28831  ORF Transcript_15821/g.28831 Transcript_15821/m.28831 type:complete len:295 (-) Transcript_15821:639-1523(-)
MRGHPSRRKDARGIRSRAARPMAVSAWQEEIPKSRRHGHSSASLSRPSSVMSHSLRKSARKPLAPLIMATRPASLKPPPPNARRSRPTQRPPSAMHCMLPSVMSGLPDKRTSLRLGASESQSPLAKAASETAVFKRRKASTPRPPSSCLQPLIISSNDASPILGKPSRSKRRRSGPRPLLSNMSNSMSVSRQKAPTRLLKRKSCKLRKIGFKSAKPCAVTRPCSNKSPPATKRLCTCSRKTFKGGAAAASNSKSVSSITAPWPCSHLYVNSSSVRQKGLPARGSCTSANCTTRS